MPLYDYFCPSNNRKVEVMHSIDKEVKTWGEVCQLAQCEMGETPADAPVRRVLSAPMVSVPTSNSDYRNAGFTKLVKRDQGVYENVTAKD
ncbi:MAG: zinc ribbon domain-containing protein [Cyanobacteria bacterium J06592_8]